MKTISQHANILMLLNIRKTNASRTENKSLWLTPIFFFFFFSSFTQAHSGYAQTFGHDAHFQVSSTAHTQGKQLKCTVKKETSLILKPQRTSFSLANIRLPVGMESHFVQHCLKAKQVLHITQSSECWHGLNLCSLQQGQIVFFWESVCDHTVIED